jgi:hypothetical protein
MIVIYGKRQETRGERRGERGRSKKIFRTVFAKLYL